MPKSRKKSRINPTEGDELSDTEMDEPALDETTPEGTSPTPMSEEVLSGTTTALTQPTAINKGKDALQSIQQRQYKFNPNLETTEYSGKNQTPPPRTRPPSRPPLPLPLPHVIRRL